MKKILALLLALTMVVMIAGCRSEAGVPGEGAVEASGDYKIGIVTGTVSQNEEEFRAAEQMVEKYGKDKIVTTTYPDSFSSETETTVANIVALANDPDIKAIVICPAVPGTSTAINKVRETRPEMLFIAGVPLEDPEVVSAAADVVMLVDEISMGTAVPTQAVAQGAKTYIHYSFPRHLSIETVAKRREIMKATCEDLGIEFVDVTVPDPTGDAGITGAQQFIAEDVPRQVEKYGEDTAFFSTNCAMMEPLIKSIAEQGAIFPQQCCPSPYHGYPGAFSISVEGHEGDVDYMLEQTKLKIEEAGNSGRMSTWSVPVNMLTIEAGTDYAIQFLDGEIERNDSEALSAAANKVANCELSNYESADGPIDNYYLILSEFYNF